MQLLMAMSAPVGPRFESRQGYSWEIVFRLLTIACVCAVVFLPVVDGLGSMSTIAASYSGNTSTVCGISKGGIVRCWSSGNVTQLRPGGILGISGGNGVVCGLTEDKLFCWFTATWARRRLSNGTALNQVAVGENQVCGLYESNGSAYCWRGEAPPGGSGFKAIAAGSGFSCRIAELNGTVQCWGPNAPSNDRPPAMSYISAGVSHVCGIRSDDGHVTCWGGSNDTVPAHGNSEFDSLALGANYTCARRRINGTVVCWGSGLVGGYPQDISFVAIVASNGYTCGIVTPNLKVLCWGGGLFGNSFVIDRLNDTLPGLCQPNNSCTCGVSENSDSFCGVSSRAICSPCPPPPPPPPPPPSPITPPPSSPPRVIRKLSRASIPLTVIGSIGALIGAASVSWWVYYKFFRRARRRSGRVCDVEHQQQMSTPPTSSTSPGRPKQRTTSRQTSSRRASRTVRRQRSGPSKRAEEFSFLDLSVATGGFSDNSKIGSGSFGTVYHGTLPDGRRVAIKRSETRTAKKSQENESAFDSELSFMTRLHHKHLVALVGYCEEDDERLLVYDYMPNGSLHDHLHKVEVIQPPLDSWAVRIKIALDSARGIEYLHTYAVPAIIHRDIKSSNILLDGSWNAKVSDFGLSLLGPSEEDSHLSLMAAGTVGYMDPEYYRMQHLTTKSDVYSFGVVLLELLTGKKAIHKPDGSGGPINVVDYALPHIDSDGLPTILDDRLPPPRPYEIEAVTFVGSTAADCVNLEGKDRPSMTEVVANLETALAYCTQAAVSVSRSRSRSLESNDDNFGVL